MESRSIDVYETDLYVCVTPLVQFLDDLLEEFHHVVDNHEGLQGKHLLINLENVTVLSSRAIAAMIKYYKQQHSRDKQLALVRINETLRNLLESVNVTKVISLFYTEEAFLESLGTTEPLHSLPTPATGSIDTRDQAAVLSFSSSTSLMDTAETDFVSIFSALPDKPVVVDCSPISSLDESSISSFVDLADRMSSRKHPVILAALNGITRDLFGILGIDEKFVFCDTVEEGLRVARGSEG